MTGVLALTVFTLAAYAVLAWLGNLYSLRTHWQPPAGSPDPDDRARRSITLGLGALSAAVGGLCIAGWVAPWPVRLVMAFESALLAAAGASDLRRFHLPLPFTLSGIGVALVIAVVAQLPGFLLLFGLGWALVVMLLHVFTSKGSMQLGDHIATLWIALAAPFNGLIAVVAGDFANAIWARVKDLRGKKVAAAGAWLIGAAVLAGMPPYLTWFPPAAQTVAPVDSVAVAPMPVATLLPVAAALPTATPQAVTLRQAMTAEALITLSEWAGERTGRVGLLAQRDARVANAQQVSGEVARYAIAAGEIAPGTEMALALKDLSTALKTYDVDQVRDASERMAQQRELLEPLAVALPTLQAELNITQTVTQTQSLQEAQ